MMRIMGMEPTSEQLTTIIESIDVDGNGKIELPEFANMMARQMLLRDGKVRRAAASAHLTHSPHGGVQRLPGALWCCAVLHGARWLPRHGARGRGRRSPARSLSQPAIHAGAARSPRQWRAQRWRAKWWAQRLVQCRRRARPRSSDGGAALVGRGA